MGRRLPSAEFLFIVVAICLGLAAAEGTVRLYAALGGRTGNRLAAFDPIAMRIAPHGDFGYRQVPNATFIFSNGAVAHSNSQGYRGPETSLVKTPGTYRIILLGESTTEGFGVMDDETIDSFMRDKVTRRYPNIRFEVVNLALSGYDSYQLFERMRTDGMPRSPDLVIINSGINDVRNAKFSALEIPGPDRRTLIWETDLKRMREEQRQGGPGVWSLAKHFLLLLRLPGFLCMHLHELDLAKQGQRLNPMPDAVEYFVANIRRTAELAHRMGASILFSTPPSALRYYEPTATSLRSYWIANAATTEEYRRRLAVRMQRLAGELANDSWRIGYVAPELPVDSFLPDDDCHLNPGGNRAVAEKMLDAADPMIATSIEAWGAGPSNGIGPPLNDLTAAGSASETGQEDQ